MAAEMAWYVLRAVSGKEMKVKEYIDAEIKNGRLGGHVSQVLIPTEKVKALRGNKQVIKERLYLPGYVLVEARLVGETVHELRNTPNVLGFLGGMDNPTPLRESEVNRILGKVDELESEPQEVEIPYIVGEPARPPQRRAHGLQALPGQDLPHFRRAALLRYAGWAVYARRTGCVPEKQRRTSCRRHNCRLGHKSVRLYAQGCGIRHPEGAGHPLRNARPRKGAWPRVRDRLDHARQAGRLRRL